MYRMYCNKTPFFRRVVQYRHVVQCKCTRRTMCILYMGTYIEYIYAYMQVPFADALEKIVNKLAVVPEVSFFICMHHSMQ